MKYNIFTVDVEGHIGTDPVKNLIYADLGEQGKWGIDKIMDICDTFGVKGLFFVDIAEAWHYGEERIAEVLRHIKTRGHDVGVHIHPDHMADCKRLFLWEYTYEEQYEIIKKCTEFYERVLGKKPLAFRAGKYGANYDTLDILSELGYRADFSQFYGQRWCGINPPLTCTKMVRYKGLLEVPTTAYRSFTCLGYSRFDKLDAGMALGEFKTLMPRLAESDAVDVVVSFAHSFSLIDWRARADHPRTNRKLACRLEKMFRCIEETPGVTNVSLEQLLDETEKQAVSPSFEYVEMKGLKAFFYFGKRAMHVLKMRFSNKVAKKGMNKADSVPRVLVVKLSPYNALTSSNMRTMALIKGLQEKGYVVDWLTIAPSAVHTLRNVSELDFMNKVNCIFANNRPVYDKIVTHKAGIKAKLIGLLRKMYHAFSMYDYTQTIANKVTLSSLPENTYKYVFSVSDPKSSHIALRQLRKQGLKFDKWIQYWGDPLAGDITNKNVYPGFVLVREERKLFASCDRIVYTSPLTLRDEALLHPQYKDKMLVVPTPLIEKKCYGSTNNERPLVSYFGSYRSDIRNIIPLYDAVKKEDSFDLLIVGDSDLQLETADNVEIKPRGDIAEDEKRTDIYVCILNNSGTQIPGKVYHDAATDKPVLVVLDGEAGNEIKEYLSTFERYYFCENNADAIADALNHIVHENKKWEPSAQMEPACVVKRMLDFD